MGHRPKNIDTTLNVSGETYCKAVGHHPVKRGREIECSNCGMRLPDDTRVPLAGRHIYVMREGKMVEVPKEEVRLLKRRRVHSLTKPGPAVGMDDLVDEYEQDAINSRRRLITRRH